VIAPRRSAAVFAAAAALAAGCGEKEEEVGDAPAPPAGGVTTAADARVEGNDGQKIAEVTKELLEAKDGDEPCYAIVASDYVESLGGLEGCAKKFGPIATGPLDTIRSAGIARSSGSITWSAAGSPGA